MAIEVKVERVTVLGKLKRFQAQGDGFSGLGTTPQMAIAELKEAVKTLEPYNEEEFIIPQNLAA